MAVAGGSHGGLLTGHLVGQHPGRFRAGALRNPVMDVSLMVHVSDIPDWCYCEGWGAEVRRRVCGSRVVCTCIKNSKTIAASRCVAASLYQAAADQSACDSHRQRAGQSIDLEKLEGRVKTRSQHKFRSTHRCGALSGL